MSEPVTTGTAAGPEVAALVVAARDGDRAAFGTLYERYRQFVHGVLLAHAAREEVPDLLQDVFLRALRQLATLREPAAFGGWIAALARNEARMRHRAVHETVELSPQLAGPPPAEVSEALQVDDVLRALRALPERYREPLTLRLVEQMGGEAIAERLGLTHGTVRVYLHHGLKLLREQLGERND